MMKSLLMASLLLLSVNSFAGDIAKGKKLFKKVNCALCHNADGMGKAKNGKIALLKGPQIAGLDAAYIVEQVTAIQGKKRKTKNTSMMMAKVKKLKPAEIKDIAAYVNSLSKTRFVGMLQKK
ncbi:putative cytochrome C [Halobacteriovorax marinus SJ]|uniref:Cytochrome C n=1 Tax=Halobacteriovorax marinus (strain ATCC BAA-682 / DSM 15412 / SJ) TaxID=862908 RepID=E1X3N5_HALMS|nr:c-type cytochrome [Halobacteriovorax marinus]CBW26964.1 putative cytochrome C [Halobacteriovorax marinus SJ]